MNLDDAQRASAFALLGHLYLLFPYSWTVGAGSDQVHCLPPCFSHSQVQTESMKKLKHEYFQTVNEKLAQK